ncbi:PREDICTED: uncharacterized protein C5orf42-like, partial [Nanorana parkeri]|uniref:uncharacterized protein C5orf42-like n=1 Tax=Nanorana parkeri TaxID=125878 RepID=UPI000854A498
MELSLEVLLSTSIKRKKPCTRLCWLGQEKEAVFLVDENRISEISLRSGSVKKPLLKKSSIVTLATSANGAWLAALKVSGELSLWSKDLDCLLTIPAIADISQLISVTQETSLKLYLYVSGDGNRVLLATHTGCVYLWENTEEKNRSNPLKARTLSGRWTKIEPHDTVVFPSTADNEATVHAMFLKSEVLGDCCLCTFVYYSGSRLMMTFLSLRWLEGDQKYNSVCPFNVHWAQQNCPLDTIYPICEPVKSRGALVAAFSKDGLVQALAINQKDPKATCVVFINTMNVVTVCGTLKGCSSKNQQIPARYLRSYWVANMSWTSDSLFLACVLKRGSLLLLTRLGELLTLTTSGCSVEFGPAEFIPLHPLITYRPPVPILESHNANDSLGSVASETDLMRQRFSVTCHPRLPYLIVSDGYMVTALRFAQNLSPYHFMKSLLLDSAQRLENVRQSLQLGKSKKNRIKLRSLSSLKATLLKDADKPPSVHSTVPSFLQDEEEICGHLESCDLFICFSSCLQDDDEESDDQEHLKYKAPSNSTFGRAEQGRLEFASMFDTIHASDHTMVKSDMLCELLRIRKTLLTAWATGVTMRNIAELDSLLQYTVGCLTHFLSLLQSPNCPSLKSDKPSKASGRGDTLWSYFGVLQQCLTALYWDVSPRQAFGHMIKLSAEVIKLILVQSSQLYSKSLLEGFCLLKTVSLNLATIYGLSFESVPAGFSMGDVAHLDVVNSPVFEALMQPLKGSSVCYVFKEPPNATQCRKSEKRLAVLWRLLYNQTLWYQARLRKQMSLNQSMQLSPEVQSEEKAIVSLLCHIQAELQAANQHLSLSLSLLPVTGEEYFLFGSYKESVEFWKRELLEASLQGGVRAGLLQTRYYLAMLYCHLYHYNLNDAQGLCDQLVKELLLRSELLAETENVGEESDERLLKKIHPEAALAVIQSMGRFMVAYFTNQLLYVFPPHNVCVLAPLHITIGGSNRFPRVVTLQHSVVASAVRDQNLSSVWTVEYALDLLLIGGLIPEAAWLANKLGDWKMSVSMAVAYNQHLKSIPDESKENLPSMPLYLSLAHIFQEKLQSYLGQPPHLDGLEKKNIETKQFTDPIEEEDADVLFNSVQEMLKAAVMADAEILTETLRQLMESAKELARKLPGLVPERLYLPAPPLYCPQPSSVSEEDPSDLLLQMEKLNRQKLSGVLQRILLLLRAAHCSLPAAQWYIKQIKRARKIMQKIRAKGALPPLSPLPEALLNYANGRTVFLKPGASGDLVSSSVVGCFRELCALCWMLHVRERLSLSCRKYQKARDSGKLFKSSEEYDSCVTEHCFEALEWACRMLPFTRVTNCEELIQDIILSLISELPPVKKVAEFMVKAFPHPDDVRVPLREKFHSVQQRLRHSVIKGLEGEEMMSVVTHNVQRVRVKALKRVQRNIGPMEMHVWEPPLDENMEDESHCYDKYSLGTSLSRSTLTDLGRIYSDTDTLSDTFFNNAVEDRYSRYTSITPFSKPVLSGMPNKVIREKTKEGNEMPIENEPALPKVGTWEFECDDEEYTNFLDLFLSYLLERDLLHSTEPGVPFLTSFAPHLRERELNSLAFDVHTTLKRKLGRPEIKSVFRAGSCYIVHVEPPNESAVEGTFTQTQNTTEPTPVLCSTVVLGKPVSSAEKYFHKVRPQSVKNGLFGLQDQKAQKCHEDDCNLTFSGYTFDQYSYSLIQDKHCTPSEELGAELQAKYSNEVKLVEWMIRWSDRRLFWCTGKAELCHVRFNTTIRVKTSSAAILTSVWLLEKPYLVPPRQYIVAPIVPHAVKPSLQRELSVEGEDSLSERGSLSVVHEEDPELLEEHSSRASSIESMVSPDMSPERQSVTSQDKSVDDTSVLSEYPMEQIPVPSETEGEQDDQPDTQRSPKISVSICPVPAQAENVYSEVEENAEDPEQSSVDEIPQQLHSDPTISSGSPLPQPSPSVTNVPLPPAPSTNVPEFSNGGQSTQPANTSEAVRQLFQDEMFRLLQLQQVNFMSLMQVVGSSFAALPAIQQVLQHTAQMTGNLVANPTVGQAPLQFIPPAPLQFIPPAPQNDARPQTQRVDIQQALEIEAGEAAETKPINRSGNKENLQNLQISPAPRLIPLQNLIAFERDAAQKGEPGSIQLLKANIQPFEEVGNSEDSIKRQRRRSQKDKGEQKEKKTSVTFRPDISIITPNNFDEVVQNEKVLHDEPNLKEDNEFVVPLGTFESELTDQIPGPLFPTMAELHYLASLTKRPPEVHNASTSTDYAGKSLMDMGTSYEAFSSSPVVASPPAAAPSESHKPLQDKRTEELQSYRMATSAPAADDISADDPLHLPPVLFLNLPYDEQQGKMFQKKDTSPTYVEENQRPVTDLDEEEFLRHFPGIEDKLPSSADLHLMAASKKNALSREMFPNTDILQSQPWFEDDQPSTVNGVMQPERPVNLMPDEEPVSKFWTPRAIENNNAFYRMNDMDAQLRALQNMAESMERDFANTELLVNTIENLATALDPDPNTVRTPREPAVPGHEPTLNEMVLEDLAEEEEFTLPSSRNIRFHGQPLEAFITGKPSARPLTVHLVSDPRQDKLVMEKSTVSEQLQMTGLSDIADILTDLMEGGVSASELGLTETQAHAISRQRLQNTSKRSQKEKAELRMWMKKKQRERLSEYRKKLEELKEREHKPFQLQHNALRKDILEGKDVNLASLLIAAHDVTEHKAFACEEVSVVLKARDPRLSRKLSISEFVIAFGIYRDVVCSASPNRREELDAYLHIVMDLAYKYGGLTYYDYHRAFSAKAAAGLSQFHFTANWGRMYTELFCRHFAGLKAPVCMSCQSSVHTTN